MIKNKHLTLSKYASALRVGSCLAVMTLLVGCSSDGDSPDLSIDSVSLYSDLNANLNSATPVDLVLTYDSQVDKMVSSLSASKYFQNSLQLQRDNPTSLDVWHWELVPGQSVVDFEIDQSKGDALNAYVFANYLTPGDHRIKVAPSGKVKILLLKNDLKDLTMLNVQQVTQGVTSPQPLNSTTAAAQTKAQKKVQQVSRSTGDFKEFDTRPKGAPPELTPPYVFEVPGRPNKDGNVGPMDLRPADSKKGHGDTNLVFPSDQTVPSTPPSANASVVHPTPGTSDEACSGIDFSDVIAPQHQDTGASPYDSSQQGTGPSSSAFDDVVNMAQYHAQKNEGSHSSSIVDSVKGSLKGEVGNSVNEAIKTKNLDPLKGLFK